MNPMYFHFTLGPVQGFVAQARRTRDFWAGSFILSWLSAVAMQAVKQQGGTITFPQPDQAFMTALEQGGTGPTQGSIPNRFKAKVPDGFDATASEKAVRAAWRALAEQVWKADLAGSAGPETRAIWERQIAGFWDMQWALVDHDNESNTLDRLKNWRTHSPPDEPGVKCMMMDGWQELSGAIGPGQRLDDPQGPGRFWKALRGSDKSGMKTDLREAEMLCAIAFVKRRFARHFKTFRATMPGDWTTCGWGLPNGVPSVHYMAAAPWLAKLLEKAAKDDDEGQKVRISLARFHATAYVLTGEYGEWKSNIACVKQAPGKFEWKALDGTVFFDSMLENPRLWGEKPKQSEAKEVLGKLKDLRDAANIEPVSPFYAVLLMDGDELGIHMSEQGKQAAISKGLADFTQGVPAIVQQHNGFLVYAGGDDVLALLPLEDALGCAATLRDRYLSCFDLELIPTSLSGAIEYAHIKMPLGKVLHDAHDLLDAVAKEDRGRDAIACRVWKPGGLALEWAMPWECAISQGRVIIDKLAEDFRRGMAGEDDDLASKFFYRIRERFEMLNPHIKGGEPILEEGDALDLMAMEYLNSGKVETKLGMEGARARIRPLLGQCRPVTRNKNQKDSEKWTKSERLEADGALLVRFLAQKGVER